MTLMVMLKIKHAVPDSAAKRLDFSKEQLRMELPSCSSGCSGRVLSVSGLAVPPGRKERPLGTLVILS